MKNNFYLIFFAWIINLIFITNIFSSETFNFDVTEIEIKEEGNKFFGKKGGIVTTDDGIIIKAKNFDYTKDVNILIASGDVKIVDKINQSVIYSQKITYFKNKELIESEGKSSAVSGEIEIFADKLLYNKNANIIKGKNDVEIINATENYSIYSDDITYFRNDEKIFSRGPTKAIFENKYNFLSSDVTINQKLKDINSIKNTTITDDNLNNYKLSSFKYLYEKKTFER
jgi:LPS-assembly protein